MLWQKYLFLKLTKTFFSFLFVLFALYLIVDLSIHGIRFFSHSTFFDILLFYLQMFGSLFEMLITLTFLLTLLRLLFDLNLHGELTALQMAGLSKKRLLSPFFFFAAGLSLLCLINSQWFAPYALDETDTFRSLHKSKKHHKVHLSSIALSDHSELVYQRFDPLQNQLFDLFWIRSPQDIWHMKTLHIDSLQAEHVDHFTRSPQNQLIRFETFLFKDFSHLPWDQTIHPFTPFENRPLFTLLLQSLTHTPDKRSLCSHLFYKLLLPLMPIFTLLAIAPLATRFSRTPPLFLITTLSLFSFIAIKVIFDGMLILGENQVLPSYLALLGPAALLLVAILPPYLRLE